MHRPFWSAAMVMGLSQRSAVLVGAALLAAACNPLDPFHTSFDAREDAQLYTAARIKDAPTAVSKLLVMTWNIKFAGGRLRFFFECGGERSLMTKKEVISHLRGIAVKINQVHPDVLLLQEVDVESKRCAYVDSVQWLLNHTDLNYGAYASQWRADFVPSDGIGRIDSGNAVLSRWPFLQAERLALPLIDDQSGVTQYFYLRRNILRTQLDLPDADDPFVLTVHTSAFAEDNTKKLQLNMFQAVLDEIDRPGLRFVAGGDLNSLPAYSRKRGDFPDDNCSDGRFEGDDYTGEDTWLDGLYGAYLPAIALADYRSDNTPYFSFTGDERTGWTRKLDYLFTNGAYVPNSGLVHQSAAQGGLDTIMLSDHAPLTVELNLP